MFYEDEDEDDVFPAHTNGKSNGKHHAAPKPRPLDEGSAARYNQRLLVFERDERVKHPRLLHHMLWMLHNCVAHPILALAPNAYAVEMHDLTSQWLNHHMPQTNKDVRHRMFTARLPDIENKGWWFFHNAIAHVAIGLVPCDTTFKLHDWSAKNMDVPGWV